MGLSIHALESRARRAYELARLRRAMLGAIPLAVLVALASLLTTRLELTVVFGAMLLIGGVGSMWWGHEMDRA